ncbi:MAG: rane of secreted protein, partial [Gemmatimonadetes bacterium]|nr:rane of secreted protein [Gemmatimonadota bacterium]
LPAAIGHVGMTEYHAPPSDSMGPVVEPKVAPAWRANLPVEIRSRVVTTQPPADVVLSLRAVGDAGFRRVPMRRVGSYEYGALIPDSLRAGRYEYAVTVRTGDTVTTFPGAVHGWPSDWDYAGDTFFGMEVVSAATPVILFEPARDVSRLAFTRIGDAGRRGLYRVVTSPRSGVPAFRLEWPTGMGRTLADYTASLVLKERITARRDDVSHAAALVLHARALRPGQQLHVTLVERDGTGWSAAVPLDTNWAEIALPLSRFTLARSVALPLAFPGQWKYWIEPASGRGGPGDALRLGDVERLQLSLRPDGEGAAPSGSIGVELESIRIDFH